MNRMLLSLLTVIAAHLSSGSVRGQITTVILSTDNSTTLNISKLDGANGDVDLTFEIPAAPFPGATVKKCTLRVVPTPQGSTLRADQDVTVLLNNNQVGQWSAYSKTNAPYVAELRPEACTLGSTSVLTLRTESEQTKGEYYGGGAAIAANQPRLIVTYDSPSSQNPARSGESTDWKYARVGSFFFSKLLTLRPSETLLANPVSYDGAVFLIAGSGDARRLIRLAGAGKATDWPLKYGITAESFAFITASGQLQIITTDAIYSCDLTTLGDLGTNVVASAVTGDQKIHVEQSETPAMGPDGSLYFKNVKAAGSVVAYNPALHEIWRTDLKLTAVSPIAVSANGLYAYLLAEISTEDPNAASRIELLRIDTATGATVNQEIKNPDGSSPLLETLLRPVIASKDIGGSTVDYVFVAGNTSDTGILQLVAFEPNAQPRVVWSRLGMVATAPVLSVADGNSLFAVQGGILNRYPWFAEEGAYQDADMNEVGLIKAPPGVSTMLIDGGNTIYMGTGSALYSITVLTTTGLVWYSPPAPNVFVSPSGTSLVFTKLLFTTDGKLIGVDNSNNVYDLSPKTAGSATLSADTLASQTIYSADRVTVAANSASQLQDGDQVILKGAAISLPNGFRWPRGKTLKLQTVR